MAVRFRKCILHIGTEKTGTTSLQAFLAANRTPLAQKGFYVPRSLSPYKLLANHERLTTFSLDLDKVNDDLRRAAGLRTQADVLAHRQRVQSEFFTELCQVETLPPTLVLSNEHCHSRLITEREVRRLADFLADFTDTVDVVVYLRPQHELATSLYDQALKAGYADIDVLPCFESNGPRWVERIYFDYDALTTRWMSVFGQANITPRIFSRSRLVNSSITDDFMAYLGCEMTGLERTANSNTSISAKFQPALNALNRYAKTHPDSMPAKTRARTIIMLQKLSTEDGRRPSRVDATAFLEMFAESNDRVRQRFFPDQQRLFDVSLDNYPESAAAPQAEVDALAEVLLSKLKSDP